MCKVIDIFSVNIEKEARALLDFMDAGDLTTEKACLEADLNGKSTRPFSEFRELIEERLATVKFALKLLGK